MSTVNLGKRLPVGTTFRTTTKQMTKNQTLRWSGKVKRLVSTYEVYRPGDRCHFTKGKRIYYCEVLYLQEIRTGLYTGPGGPRYWVFTYEVKVLEN